jgi:hypothetical protein
VITKIEMATSLDCNNKLLFENQDNKEIKDDLVQLPSKMKNPYLILKRYIKWEIKDLEAIIDSIESRADLVK